MLLLCLAGGVGWCSVETSNVGWKEINRDDSRENRMRREQMSIHIFHDDPSSNSRIIRYIYVLFSTRELRDFEQGCIEDD